MPRHSLAMFIAIGLTTSAAAQNQRPHATKPIALTPRDYIDIQQLSARYAFAIDTCTNGGTDFADLFSEDCEFSVSQQWGIAGNRRTQGRSALVKAAVVTPTPSGAIGKSYLLALGVGGDPTPTTVALTRGF